MTLSQFLRDYLYIRLGGNRHGSWRRHINLLVTMLLGGLWHGANWTFVAWGGLHGVFLVINHGWRKFTGAADRGSPCRGGAALTFMCVLLAWVLFRSDSFATAAIMFSSMLGLNGISLPPGLAHLAAGAGLHADSGGVFERNLAPFSTLGINRYLSLTLFGLMLVLTCPNTQELLLEGSASRLNRLMQLRPRLIGAVFGLLFCLTLANLDKVSTFLYYQF